MGPVSVLYTAFASIALFTCFLQLFLALKKSGDVLTLISAVLSFVVFIRYSLISLFSAPFGMADDHLTLLRCQLILTQAIIICMLGLIFQLLKDGRKLFILLNVLLVSLFIILCLILPDNLLFGNQEVVSLQHFSHDDSMMMISKGFSWWRAITDMSILLFAFSTFMLLMKKLKTVQYKKIIIFYTGSGLILLAAIYDQFIDLGSINSIYLLPFAVFLFYMILNFIPFLYLLEEVAESNMISQQEKKFRNLVNDAGVIVVGLNRMGNVEFINRFFLELTGYQEDEVIGKDWFEFFIPPKESYNVQGAFIEALASDFHPYYENPILTKSKEEKMIRWFNVRTRDQHENITGSLSIGVDITEDFREKQDIVNKLIAAEELIDHLKNN
jgi:PAS domain S-box-containing protein